MIKRIVLLSLSGFFFAILAAAFHCHCRAFFLSSCSNCNVKISITEAIGKKTIDSKSVLTVVPHALAAVFLTSAALIRENRATLPHSQTADVWPNKAPPVRS